jgi:hypothetical protein
MVGDLANPRVGSVTYNIVHTYVSRRSGRALIASVYSGGVERACVCLSLPERKSDHLESMWELLQAHIKNYC